MRLEILGSATIKFCRVSNPAELFSLLKILNLSNLLNLPSAKQKSGVGLMPMSDLVLRLPFFFCGDVTF